MTGRHGPSAAAGWWRRRHCGELLALEGSRRMKWARHETACQAGLGQGVDVLVAGRPQVGGLLRGDHDGARAEELRVRALIPLLSAPRAGPVSGSLARVFKGEGRRPIDEVEGEQGQQQQTRDAQESYPRRSSVRVSVGGHPRQSRRRAPVYIARWRKAEVAEPALPRPSPTRGDSIHGRESWRKRVGVLAAFPSTPETRYHAGTRTQRVVEGRTALLSRTGGSSHYGWTQLRSSPENPGRFRLSSEVKGLTPSRGTVHWVPRCVHPRPPFEFDEARTLFTLSSWAPGNDARSYDVSPDGQLVFMVRAPDADDPRASATGLRGSPGTQRSRSRSHRRRLPASPVRRVSTARPSPRASGPLPRPLAPSPRPLPRPGPRPRPCGRSPRGHVRGPRAPGREGWAGGSRREATP